jgi:hypothetical protein
LRLNANRGAWRSPVATGGSTEAVNQFYLRTVSAHHLPSGASLIFMRLEQENCWYLSLCFASDDAVQAWNPEAAEPWLCALFGEDRRRAIETEGASPNVRQFTLAMGQ